MGGWLWFFLTGPEQALLDARNRASSITSWAGQAAAAVFRPVDLALEVAERNFGQADFAAPESAENARRLFADLAGRTPDLQGLWILDRTGRVVVGETAALAGMNMAESDFFRSHLNGPPNLYIGGSLEQATLAGLVPVSRALQRSGSFDGVLLATINAAGFQRLAEALGLPNGADVLLLTRQGNVVASSGAGLLPLDREMRRKLAEAALDADDFSFTRLAVAGPTPDSVQEEMLVGARPVKSLNLVALYAVPYITALQAWTYQMWIGSALLVIAILVVIGGTILIMLYGRRQGDLHRILGLRTAEAAQAAERLALAVDTTGIGIFDYHAGHRQIAWAGVETSYFGLRPPPALTPRAMLRAVHPADRPGLIKRLRTMKAARNDMRFDTEFRLRHPEFGAIWVAARAKLFVRNGNGEGPPRLIGTLRDITERRRLQEHRETVLREINHRIKNSLQLMNSIMNLQSRRITSPDERGRFEAARRRLISLATVYAHLDDTTQPDVVDLVSFLRRLCQDFAVAYMADGRINLSFNATGGSPISATLAVPLGMAMGEILVNTSLNGFAPQATGAVIVNLAIEGDRAEIAISHNGRNVEQAFAGDGASLGRLLIDAFVEQLGGTFAAENRDPGLCFTLRFRIPPLLSSRTTTQVNDRGGST